MQRAGNTRQNIGRKVFTIERIRNKYIYESCSNVFEKVEVQVRILQVLGALRADSHEVMEVIDKRTNT